MFLAGMSQKGYEKALMSVLFICAVFACVLIHELGHSLVARHFGIQAKSITLLPIGGIAAMDEMPEKPAQEITMTLIGPFINLAIAGILYLFAGSWAGITAPNLYPVNTHDFLTGLIGVNIILAGFNLIPAFPMDGGRALRGFLAMRMSYVKATSLSVSIGQAISMVFIFYGIFFNFWLALIGIFLIIGAGSEKRHVLLSSLLRGVEVQEAMTTEFHSLKPDDLLSRVLEQAYHVCQDDFPVIGESGIQGIITRSGLLAAVHEKGLGVPVSEVMDRDYAKVNSRASLDDVYRLMLTTNKTVAAVIDGDYFSGILSLDGISRYFMIQANLRGVQ